jgi:hypothetical protein
MSLPPASPLRRSRVAAVGIVLALVVVGCSGGGAKREDALISKAGEESVFELRAGDCLDPPEVVDEQVGELPAVPCSSPHTHEVIAVWEAGNSAAFAGADELSNEVYPGESELGIWAERACLNTYPEYVAASYFDSDLFLTHLLPTLDGWGNGDRSIVCLVRTTGWKMASSVHCSGGLRGALEVPADTKPEGSASAEELEAAYPVPVGEPCPAPTSSFDS